MAKHIDVSFEHKLILSKREAEKLPVDTFIEALKGAVDCEIEVQSKELSGCTLILYMDISDEDAEKIVRNVLETLFTKEEIENNIYFAVNEFVDDFFHDQIFDTDEIYEVSDEKEKAEPSSYTEIQNLVGVEEFKTLAKEFLTIAPKLLEHGLIDTFTHQSYIFSINDGHGLTTYLDLFSKLLKEIGLFKINETLPFAEVKLLPPQSKESGADPFAPAKSLISGGHGIKNMIISVDISEWMTKVREKRFKDFLSLVDDNLGNNIVVFRVPFVEKEILSRLKAEIGDILYVRDISFVPFDNFELIRYAESELKRRGFTIDEAAWDVFRTRIAEEKNDGRFYGINTVNKVIREMLYRKMLENCDSGVNDTVIKKDEISGLALTYEFSQKSAMEQLDEFIGMDTVKNRIHEIVSQIEMSLNDSEFEPPCVHMRFVGNPGTGKTTVARIIGKILKERGILRNGNFFEYSGRDLCGRYVGETAPKTSGICRDAYGSVLFIDEAYSLYRGKGTSTVDYGREAIDTLIAEMENHRCDLVVIMAGYTDEMNDLMQANAGLASRMPYVIEFPNYTREQLFEIFIQMAGKSFGFESGFEDAVKDYFMSLPDEIIGSKEFSNARFVRNLFERTWGKAVLRAQIHKDCTSTLKIEDFLLASSEKEFKIIMEKKKSTLGFI